MQNKDFNYHIQKPMHDVKGKDSLSEDIKERVWKQYWNSIFHQKIEGKITAADSETNEVTIVLDMDATGIKIGSKVKVTLEK